MIPTQEQRGFLGDGVKGIKYSAVSIAYRFGLAIAKPTDTTAIAQFARRMAPVETDHPLVRLGCDGDGGYLVPDDLDGITACFSPGVDYRATFEEGLLERGIRCHLADASVDRNPLGDERSTFRRQYLGVVDAGEYVTLDRWVAEEEPGDTDLLLQMDIEGAEWPVLLNVSNDTMERFRIIVVELHDMERLLDRHAFRTIAGATDRLLTRFDVVHIHPNNYGGIVRAGKITIPRSLEVTLLRKDRIAAKSPATCFPHPLDQPNTAALPEVILPVAWRTDSRCR
jgi:Methyltransferase FkbM domain